MNLRFSGVNIVTAAPEQTDAFYRQLGLRVVEEGAPGKYYGAEYALGEGDGPRLWIWRQQEGEPDNPRNLLVFDCDDLDALYEALRARGADCRPPATADWGGRELHVFDPAGNELLFL